MLSLEDHEAWASKNRSFFEEASGKRVRHWDGWAVTVLFYTALHKVKALLADRGDVSVSHKDTLRYLQKDPAFLRLSSLYSDMLQASIDARYNCVAHGPNEIKEQEANLADIDREVTDLLHLR